MKAVVWNFIKTFFAITGIEIIIFFLMIIFVMTDEGVGVIGKSLGFVVQYVLGFPLVLLNSEYPLFLNTGGSSASLNYMITLIILNLIIQTGIVLFIKNLMKKNTEEK